MATYEEVISLKDGVSAPAKAATTAVGTLLKSVRALQKLVGEGGTEKGVAGLNDYTSALQKLMATVQQFSALGPIKMPKLPSVPKAAADRPAAATKATAPDSVKAPPISGVRSTVADVPVRAVASAPVSRSVAPTLASQVHAPKSTAPTAVSAPVAAAQAPAAAAKAAPLPQVAPVKTSIQLDGGVAVAQQFKVLASGAKSAENAMVKAAAAGDQKAYDSAKVKVGEFKGALDKLPEGAAKAASSGKNIQNALWVARNAMDVGRQTIEAGIGGIKAAFSSLAQGDIKGAIQGVTDSLAGMSKMLDLIVPGLGQAVAAIISVAGGLVGLTAGLVVSGAKFAVFASQAKQAMISSFDAMGGGIVTGGQLDDMLSGLADRIGITKDELAPLTQAFLQMGVTSVDALEALTTAAISAEAITKGGAAAFTDLQKKIQLAVETGQGFKLGEKQLLSLRDAGIGVSDMAVKMGMTTAALTAALKAGTVDAKKFGDAMIEAVTEKGAGPLKRMASSFEAVRKKWDQDIGDIFEDIDVGPFMAEVKALFGIFGQATPSGQALKAGIGGFFKEVFSLATQVVPVVRHFLLDMVIWGLKAYIALKPIVQTIKDFFASATGAAVLNSVLTVAWEALKGVGIAIAVVVAGFALFAGWIALCVGFAASFVGSMLTLAVTISTAVGGAIAGAVETLMTWVAGAPQLATDFVTGLVTGITAGAGAVASAVSGVAGGAVSAFTDFLGIKSPSKVMMALGGHTSAGFAAGLEGGGGAVQGAASSVAGMAVAGASDAAQSMPAAAAGSAGASPGIAAAGGGGGGTVINIAEGAVVINGAGKDTQAISQEAVAGLFEQFALQAGL